MAVPVIGLGCDIGAKEKDRTSKWSDDKLKSLWSSLLNVDFVSKCHEDLEVQGMLLLLETTFNIFKNLKKKYNDCESACQFMKQDLESVKEDLYRAKEDQKCHKQTSCERCPELERQLVAYRKKLEYNENCIKSIVCILGMKISCEDSDGNLQSPAKSATLKAYDLASQMLLDSDITDIESSEIFDMKSGTKRLGLDITDTVQVRTLGRKRKKQNRVAAKTDILNMKERQKDVEDVHYEATLAPESVPPIERDVCSDIEQEMFPETSCSLYPTEFSDVEKTVPLLNSIGLIEETAHIQTTPKKKVLQDKVNQKSPSPILGTFGRKSTHKSAQFNNYNVTVVDSAQSRPVPSQTVVLHAKSNNIPTVINNGRGNVDGSPSLLKIQLGVSSSIGAGTDRVEEGGRERKNEKHRQNVVHCLEDNLKSTKVTKADFWKLTPTPHVDVNKRNPVDVRSCRLKQATLSLACLPKKQDLCTLKEFNGGVRQSACRSSSLADDIIGDYDKETSLKLAIQESLNEKENRESDTSEDKSPGIGSSKTDSAEEDDLISSSPDKLHPRTSRQKRIHTRDRAAVSRKGANMSNTGLMKEQIRPVIGSRDMDETLFVPLYTSTLQDGTYGTTEMKRVPETEEMSCEQNFKERCDLTEIKIRKESEIVRKHDCSFDRIPEKVSTSPNYKYRRDTLRNKEARRKLDGWDCERCWNYYAVANVGADPDVIKQHLNQCSRHRYKYCYRTNTPPGYWNMDFPSTEESESETTLK